MMEAVIKRAVFENQQRYDVMIYLYSISKFTVAIASRKGKSVQEHSQRGGCRSSVGAGGTGAAGTAATSS